MVIFPVFILFLVFVNDPSSSMKGRKRENWDHVILSFPSWFIMAHNKHILYTTDLCINKFLKCTINLNMWFQVFNLIRT